ncbi:DUF4430 domain-containing protein [uncultured Clostridium sp.]|uniref:DUF4430 domain-containing protein n=1 Tax=uncultured Clostridium sp. TaxID=59620 RepID=UPI0026726EE3|nr:DUF4430 domain-containing protein [uncultured Clostridium sp.]
MKNKNVKIGAIIIVLILAIIVSGGFMIKSYESSLTTKPEVNKNNVLITDKTMEDNSSNGESNDENNKSKEDETSISDGEELKNEENISEDKKDNLLSDDNINEVKLGSSNPVTNEEESKVTVEKNQEANGSAGSTNVSQESKPEIKPESNQEPVSKYVTISITCHTILNNLDKVSDNKKGIIPSNGVILSQKQVEINDGDTVFDVLLRETRKQRIHMDFVESPVYGSAYIKGINNIYEFDAGELSGWMYSVNGVFPNYGCSIYNLNDGDVIQWMYTCDLGKDL